MRPATCVIGCPSKSGRGSTTHPLTHFHCLRCIRHESLWDLNRLIYFSRRKRIYTYTHTHTHTHIYVYIFLIVLEKTLKSLLDCKEIKTVNSKGNQSWIFIERTDAEIPILWPPDSKNWLIGKDPEVGKDWRQEKKETTEDEMIGWLHRLDGHEFEQSPGDSEGQLSLMFCSPLGHRDLDFRLNNNNNNKIYIYI